MRKIIRLTVFITLFSACKGFKCRLAHEPTPLWYSSIKEAKENGAFIEELRPQAPFLATQEYKYPIHEAWLEHSYKQGDFRDILIKDTIMVIKFDVGSEAVVFTLPIYIKAGGESSAGTIRFSPFHSEWTKDTLVMYYRENLDSPKNKKFLLFKKP